MYAIFLCCVLVGLGLELFRQWKQRNDLKQLKQMSRLRTNILTLFDEHVQETHGFINTHDRLNCLLQLYGRLAELPGFGFKK